MAEHFYKAIEVQSPVLPKRTKKYVYFLQPPLPICATQPSGLSGNFIGFFFFQISGVAINCHTCSYMNDDGKCLRGEGICTTQNSQQCMLKKIFEGSRDKTAREHSNYLLNKNGVAWGGDIIGINELGNSEDFIPSRTEQNSRY